MGVDFVIDRLGEVCVLEINPRITASHENFELSNAKTPGCVALQLSAFNSEGISAFSSENHEHLFSAADRVKNIVCRFIIYTIADLVVTAKQSAVLMSLSHQQQYGRVVEKPSCWLSDVPVANSLIPGGTPFCTLVVQASAQFSSHRERETVMREVEHVVKSLEQFSELPETCSDYVSSVVAEIPGK